MPAPNKTRFALLGLLTFGPMSGYDLKRMFEKSLNYFWNESYGQIYPMLKKLAGEGLTGGKRESDPESRSRTVYSLKDEGMAAFREWLALPAEPMRDRNELLMKLFFGRHSSPDINRNHLLAAREYYTGLAQKFDELEIRLKEDCSDDPDQPYWLVTLGYGQNQSRALLQWCDQSLIALDEIPADRTSSDNSKNETNEPPSGGR